jgi:hypothetical protein
MMSDFFSTWPFGPSGCHVFNVALSSLGLRKLYLR